MNPKPLLPWPQPDPQVSRGDVRALVEKMLADSPEGRAAIEREAAEREARRKALLAERPRVVAGLEKASAGRWKRSDDAREKLRQAHAEYQRAVAAALAAECASPEASVLERKLTDIDAELLTLQPEAIAEFLKWLADEVDEAKHAPVVGTWRRNPYEPEGGRRLVSSTWNDQQSWMVRAIETRREAEGLHLEPLTDEALTKRLDSLREKLGDWRDSVEEPVAGAPSAA
jgi:hypothetical protein